MNSIMPGKNRRGDYCNYCCKYFVQGNIKRHYKDCPGFPDLSEASYKAAELLQKETKDFHTNHYVLAAKHMKQIGEGLFGKPLTVTVLEEVLGRAGCKFHKPEGSEREWRDMAPEAVAVCIPEPEVDEGEEESNEGDGADSGSGTDSDSQFVLPRNVSVHPKTMVTRTVHHGDMLDTSGDGEEDSDGNGDDGPVLRGAEGNGPGKTRRKARPLVDDSDGESEPVRSTKGKGNGEEKVLDDSDGESEPVSSTKGKGNGEEKVLDDSDGESEPVRSTNGKGSRKPGRKMAGTNFDFRVGTKGKILEKGLYARFPDTDPYLVAFRAMGGDRLNANMTSQQSHRVSSAFYFVQKDALPDGEVPEKLDFLAAMNNPIGFDRFLAALYGVAGMKAVSVKNYLNALMTFSADYIRGMDVKGEFTVARNAFEANLKQKLKRCAQRCQCEESAAKKKLMYGDGGETILREVPRAINMLNALFTEMKAIVEHWKVINEHKVTEAEFVLPPPTDHNKVVMYIMTSLVLDHAQRPGVIYNMTVEDFLESKESGGRILVGVSKHKTGKSGHANLSLEPEFHELMVGFHRYMRGSWMVGDENHNTSCFFRNSVGKTYEGGFTTLMTRFQKKHNLPVVSSNDSRKATETAAARSDVPVAYKEGVASYLKHSNKVAASHYVIGNMASISTDIERMKKLRGDQTLSCTLGGGEVSGGDGEPAPIAGGSGLQEPAPIAGGSGLQEPAPIAGGSGLEEVEEKEGPRSKLSTEMVRAFAGERLTRSFPLDGIRPEIADVRQVIEGMLEGWSEGEIEGALWQKAVTSAAEMKRVRDRWSYVQKEEELREKLTAFKVQPTIVEAVALITECHAKKFRAPAVMKLWCAPEERKSRRAVPESGLSDAQIECLESQDWPYLMKANVVSRGDVVRTTKPFSVGTVLCNYDGLLLTPEETKLFLEDAEANADHPEKGKTEYCYLFKHDGTRHGQPNGTWMINANNDPESVGLKKSFGRLISHSSKHPNLRVVKHVVEGKPVLILQVVKYVNAGEELLFDYGDRSAGLDNWLKKKACICHECTKKGPVRRAFPLELAKMRTVIYSFGIEPAAALELCSKMMAQVVEPVTRDWLLGLTEGYPDGDREAMVDGLLLHYRNVRAMSAHRKALLKGSHILSLQLAEMLQQSGTPPSFEAIHSLMTELKMGNGGAARHMDRETRSILTKEVAERLNNIFEEKVGAVTAQRLIRLYEATAGDEEVERCVIQHEEEEEDEVVVEESEVSAVRKGEGKGKGKGKNRKKVESKNRNQDDTVQEGAEVEEEDEVVVEESEVSAVRKGGKVKNRKKVATKKRKTVDQDDTVQEGAGRRQKKKRGEEEPAERDDIETEGVDAATSFPVFHKSSWPKEKKRVTFKKDLKKKLSDEEFYNPKVKYAMFRRSDDAGSEKGNLKHPGY
jgi:hypothetical protein